MEGRQRSYDKFEITLRERFAQNDIVQEMNRITDLCEEMGADKELVAELDMRLYRAQMASIGRDGAALMLAVAEFLELAPLKRKAS